MKRNKTIAFRVTNWVILLRTRYVHQQTILLRLFQLQKIMIRILKTYVMMKKGELSESNRIEIE